MDLNFFATNSTNPNVLIPAILKQWQPYYQWEAFKNYDPKHHKINCRTETPDRLIKVPTDDIDPKTNEPIMANKIEKVTRISLAYQKLIVKTSAAFLTNGGVTLKPDKTDAKGEELFQLVQKTWKDNKLDYKNSDCAKTALSQLECAEIWYSEKVLDANKKVVDGKMKVRFYKPSDGYSLIPVWDDNMDLIAFGLQYEDSKVQKSRYMDLYDKEKIQYYINTGSGWQARPDKPTVIHLYKKIPVILWLRDQSDWYDVQDLIDREEKVMSVYGDNNEYTGNPILFGKTDDTLSMPAKGESGKYIQGSGTSDMKFIERNGKPEPIIFEKDFLKEHIYSLTQTPDLSFEAMQGLGDISGAALERLLISAHMKAIEGHNGWYGETIQRRLNFLVSALASITPRLESAIDLSITPAFGLFKLEADADRVDIALKASGNAQIMSHEEAIRYAKLTDDADATLTKIKADSAQPANQGQ